MRDFFDESPPSDASEEEKTIWFITEDDTFGCYPNEDYINRKNGKNCRVVGGSWPGKWCERTDKLVGCTEAEMSGFQWAKLRYEDGKEVDVHPDDIGFYISDAQYLDKPKLNFLSYDDMLAMPDPVWLVDGVLHDATSALLFGKSNAFKSFLGIDLACSIATGKDWHGHTVCDPSPVLYVATEGSRGVGKQRIPGWMQAHEIAEPLRRNIQMHKDEIALDDERAIDDVLQTCANWKAHRTIANGGRVADENDTSNSVALIVIDIFGSSMMGPETTDETARAWVKNVNRLMSETGCAVLAIAHTGWADDTRARMHTHFWGSFDTRLKAEGDKDSRTSVLRVDRHKDADSTGEWGFRLEVVELDSGDTTLVPRLSDDVNTTKRPRLSKKQRIALEALDAITIDSQPVLIDQWRAACDRAGITDSTNVQTMGRTFRRVKDEMEAKGLVTIDNDHVQRKASG